MKKAKTLKDIASDPRVLIVEDLGDKDSGTNSKVDIWITLKEGYQWDNSERFNIHERSLKKACHELNTNVQEWPNDYRLKIK